jgi:hypothetical protein
MERPIDLGDEPFEETARTEGIDRDRRAGDRGGDEDESEERGKPVPCARRYEPPAAAGRNAWNASGNGLHRGAVSDWRSPTRDAGTDDEPDAAAATPSRGDGWGGARARGCNAVARLAGDAIETVVPPAAYRVSVSRPVRGLPVHGAGDTSCRGR